MTDVGKKNRLDMLGTTRTIDLLAQQFTIIVTKHIETSCYYQQQKHIDDLPNTHRLIAII